MISLIFSDIIGNPLSLIASGPTVPPESDESDALKIIDRYKLRTVGESIRSYLGKFRQTSLIYVNAI